LGRYAAFLSYSHRDAATARWLHRRLEAYRIPRRLVGSEGELGPVPARLVPIFRDREELPAAGDLSDKVRAALAESGALVILCSPAAAASPWVAKEIDTFRALHPDRPVIAAILDGEPAEAFPPNLAAGGIEPLAADLRPGHDGRRLGFLKLVAGLSGVGLDALVQRDAQRRLRRVTAVTGVALAAVVAMAVLTAVALTARAEAQRQRAEAEGLVEFMLTDLRDRLKGVGRLDVMEAVNARALKYYGARKAVSGLPPMSLLRRARILQTVGEDSILGSHLEAAVEAFEEAHRITSERLVDTPADQLARLQLARSEYGLGRVNELRGQWERAAARYRRFASLTRSLAAQNPTNREYLKEAAWSLVDRGNVELNGRNNPASAQRFYGDAVRWFEVLVSEKPGDEDIQRDLANAYGWLADSYFRRGDWTNSLRARQQQLAIVRRLWEADSTNYENAYRVALAKRGIAGSHRKLGHKEDASRLSAESYRTAVLLTQHDPENAEWLLLKGFAACDLLFGKLTLPSRVDAHLLRRDILGVRSALAAQQNPRVSEIEGCVSAAR
jgi:tetratricopeptide (TPR) repeat protein